MRAVRFAIDDERAGAADAFAAIVRERDRLFALERELVVHDVEHLEQRHVRVQVFRLIINKLARLV